MIDVGATLGGYELVAELGRGGMASLYLAHRTGPAGFERPVAVKVVRPDHVGDEAFVRMFLDEARLSARVQHPNVVQVEELGQQDGTHYLVMEYVDGVTLAEVMRSVAASKGAIPVDVAVCIAAQIADGLHGAHESTDAEGRPLGMVHRDVSPQNVLVSSRGHVKIIDFGVARAAGRLTRTEQGEVKGKLAYMTAEQLRGLEVDRRADVFALGVIVWEMLTMRRLFHGGNDASTMARILDGSVPPVRAFRPDVSEALEAAIAVALAHDREERFLTASAFRRAMITACPESLFVEPSAMAELVRGAAADALERRRSAIPEALREATLVTIPPRTFELSDAESAGYTEGVRPRESIPALEAEVARLHARGPAAEANALARLVGVLVYDGQRARAATLLPALDALAERCGPGMRAHAAALRGELAAAEGDLSARLRAQQRARDLYDDAGWPLRAARAAVNVADTENQLGAYERAERALAEALARSRQLELPSTEAYALLNLARALMMQDRFSEAEVRLGEAEIIAGARGLAHVAMIASVYRASLLCRAGRWTAARAAAERGVALAVAGESRVAEALALTHASRAALASGDRDAALEASGRAYQRWRELGSMEEGEADLLLAHVHALIAAGQRGEAMRVREEGVRRIEAMASRIDDPEWRARFLNVESHAALRTAEQH